MLTFQLWPTHHQAAKIWISKTSTSPHALKSWLYASPHHFRVSRNVVTHKTTTQYAQCSQQAYAYYSSTILFLLDCTQNAPTIKSLSNIFRLWLWSSMPWNTFLWLNLLFALNAESISKPWNSSFSSVSHTIRFPGSINSERGFSCTIGKHE